MKRPSPLVIAVLAIFGLVFLLAAGVAVFAPGEPPAHQSQSAEKP